MTIKIPKRHYQYVQMLIEAEIYPDEKTALSRVFEWGLEEGEFDAIYAGDPDMGLELLKGPQINLEVPDSPEYQKRVEFISKRFRVSISKARSIIFLEGLFERYPILKDSSLYKTNENFRKRVDNMVHDTCYDEEPEEFEEEEFE